MARTAEPASWFPSKCTDKYMPLAQTQKISLRNKIKKKEMSNWMI